MKVLQQEPSYQQDSHLTRLVAMLLFQLSRIFTTQSSGIKVLVLVQQTFPISRYLLMLQISQQL